MSTKYYLDIILYIHFLLSYFILSFVFQFDIPFKILKSGSSTSILLESKRACFLEGVTVLNDLKQGYKLCLILISIRKY